MPFSGFAEWQGLPNVSTTISAASLADLEVELGRLADYHIVGLYRLADLACRHALEALLVHNAGYIDFACEVLTSVLGKCRSRCYKAGHRAFHIAGPAAVDFAVVNLCRERRIGPLSLVPHRDSVNMTVKQDLFSRTAAFDASDDVAVPVHCDRVEPLRFHLRGQLRHHPVLMTGIALLPDQLLAQFHHLLLSLFAQH